MRGVFVGVIMYADDLLLLSASVDGLQRMLNCCSELSAKALINFNCKKSTCVIIGPASKCVVKDMKLGSDSISWSNSLKYLGVCFSVSKKLFVDVSTIKQNVFASCNCILAQAKCMDDLVKLKLLESYCLPILLYATAAMKLTNEQLCELNAAWNSVYRRIFGFNKWESVRQFIGGLGRLDFNHIRMHQRLKFCKTSLTCGNHSFENIIKAYYFSDDFRKLCFDSGISNVNGINFNNLPFGYLRKCVHQIFSQV